MNDCFFIRIFLAQWWWIQQKNFKVGKGVQKENLLFDCASVDVGRFFFFNNTLQAWDPPTFPRILQFNFSYETDFEPKVLLLKKVARCQPFLAVIRCLFHNHLRLKRSSLLNVYLKCMFQISLLTSHLFFCFRISKKSSINSLDPQR